jgi:hypothetical protein
MQPLGRKPINLPCKVDCHPPRPLVNWWEGCTPGANKSAARQQAKREIERAKAELDINTPD